MSLIITIGSRRKCGFRERLPVQPSARSFNLVKLYIESISNTVFLDVQLIDIRKPRIQRADALGNVSLRQTKYTSGKAIYRRLRSDFL